MRGLRQHALWLIAALLLLAHGAAAAETIEIRAGVHDGYARIAFAWPSPVGYRATIAGETLTIHFDRPFQANHDALTTTLGAYVGAVQLTGNGKVFVAQLKRPLALKAYTVMQKIVVVDLTPAAAAKAPPPRQAAKEHKPTAKERKAAAKEHKPPPAPAADPPTKLVETPSPPVAAPPANQVEAPPAVTAPPAATVQTPPVPAPTPIADAPAAALPPPPASVVVRYGATDAGARLTFDWPVATAGAVFRHGDVVWIVFALPTTLDLGDAQGHAQGVVDALQQVPAGDATVLRLVPRAGLEPSVRRSGAAWIVDFKPQAAPPDAPITVDVHSVSAIFRVHEASAAVRLSAPDLGGNIIVIPVAELGRGIVAPPQLVDFSVLPSVQGIVLRPYDDDLAVNVADAAVEVMRPGGLQVSSEQDRLLGHAPDRTGGLFDFAGWRGPQDVDYIARRAALEQAITAAPQGARTQPRLTLAQFYFANLFGAETLAVIDAIARDDPAAAGAPPLHALKGAACFLVRDYKCAADELGQHGLDGDAEATLWRAALAAKTGNLEAAASGFLATVNLLPSYPVKLRAEFGLAAADAMLETDRLNLVGPLLDFVRRDATDSHDQAMAFLIDAKRALHDKHLDDAVALWDKAAALNDPPTRARALYARATALSDAGRATPADTVKALDGLRFAWRGDAFEFTLLRRLGDLKLQQGDDVGGLDALEQAATYYSDDPAAKDIAKRTSDEFAALFLGPHGDDMSPLKALALYDQFHELEPVGQRRDQIVRKLIDRLVAVDLLDRAALLLEEQVTKRLAGLDKARGATQLALLDLMDHQPDAALKALDIDVGGELPQDLGRQRQQLRARVLMELGRAADALALLASDQSRDADRLRADIYWRGHDWPNAAKTLARLAGAPAADGKVDAETGRFVVSLAAALTLSDDQAGLAKLRAAYGQAMGATSFADAFHVLAGSGDGDASADPRKLAGNVAQIGELQSFMATYRQKLASAKLSTIN